MQFLFNTKIYKGDVWIDWQQFIFKGDNKQEIFTFGTSNRLFLNGKEKKHSFSVPLQSVFVHQGGQINETDEKLITYNTSAAGLNYTFRPESSLFKSISLESSYLNFLDMSSEYQLPYIQGYGIYSTATVKVLDFDLRVAHWYGEYYVTLRGHPIFSSKSTIWNGYYEDQRALVSTRVLYEKNILKGLDIGAGFEVYSDLFDYFADYWYMFYINFNRDFFIKKFK